MNEVEKMYRNAHVYLRVYGDITKETFENKVFNMADMCNEAFTAEKQLELIKFLFNHNVYYDVDAKGKYWFHISDDCYTYYYNKFEIALANIINEMWPDLTEEECKQIKEILSE